MEKIDLSERHDGFLSEAIKHKIAPELKESLNKFSEAWKQWSINNDKEFRKTLKTVKSILKQKSLILPRDWKEVIWEWYIKEELSKEDLAFLEFKDVPDLLKDPKIILRWAKQYSEKIEKEVFTPESKKTEKGEPLAVRYKLLDEFFKGNEQYNKLKVKDKEALLSIILGCHPDTAKDIKNNAVKNIPDGKYITREALDRFRDLSDKIKKGETY